MFVVHYSSGSISGYVCKHDGMNSFIEDPSQASHYLTKDDAETGKVGHHYDMGGSGFKGRIVLLRQAISDYEWDIQRRSRW